MAEHAQTTWTRRILHGQPDAFNLRQFSRKTYPTAERLPTQTLDLDRCIGLLLFNRDAPTHTHTLCVDQGWRGGWTHELCNDSVSDIRVEFLAFFRLLSPSKNGRGQMNGGGDRHKSWYAECRDHTMVSHFLFLPVRAHAACKQVIWRGCHASAQGVHTNVDLASIEGGYQRQFHRRCVDRANVCTCGWRVPGTAIPITTMPVYRI